MESLKGATLPSFLLIWAAIEQCAYLSNARHQGNSENLSGLADKLAEGFYVPWLIKFQNPVGNVTSNVPIDSSASAIIATMVLVTGGTGFIGGRVVERLLQSGEAVRILLKPNKKNPNLPKNVALNIAVSSLKDERGLRSAMKNVETIFHFATAEHQGPTADLEGVDVDGSEHLMNAAQEAGVKSVLFLGRIGADKSSSYPILRAKAIAEGIIRKQKIPYCILRLTDVFGAGDHFTTEIAAGIRKAHLIYPLPAEGKTLVQPLWIEDLVSAIMLIYKHKQFRNEIIEIGGGEFFEFRQVVHIIMATIGKQRALTSIAPAYLRVINLWFRRAGGVLPLQTSWLDLLAVERTCALDSLTSHFSILPARFSNHLDYLKNEG